MIRCRHKTQNMKWHAIKDEHDMWLQWLHTWSAILAWKVGWVTVKPNTMRFRVDIPEKRTLQFLLQSTLAKNGKKVKQWAYSMTPNNFEFTGVCY